MRDPFVRDKYDDPLAFSYFPYFPFFAYLAFCICISCGLFLTYDLHELMGG